MLALITDSESHLEYLNLGHNLLREADAQALLTNAVDSRRLKSLNLNHNRLGVSCSEALHNVIENSPLEHLYIGQNYLSCRVAEELFTALTTNKHLRVLDYSLNQLGEEGEKDCPRAIAQCLAKNRTLQHLDLSFNSLGK